ncbi:MAG: DUF2235 domain-containing protein [Maritimibacter sp.]
MKRIAIFCDGTWNRHDAKTPTHVVRLAQALAPEGADGVTQVAHYLPGVGSGEGVTWLSRVLDKFMGGAFGWGLDDRILEAYRNLVFSYAPGDEIFIFGFSRGAYTARSLAGLIRSAGIPPKDHTDRIPEAMEHYRTRDVRRVRRVAGEDGGRFVVATTDDPLDTLKPYPHPDSAIELDFRARLSPDTPTSDIDVLWREREGLGVQKALKIKYLGVWDTVGALGLPGVLGALSKLTNQRYEFHDAKLSRSVEGARHGVAIDERRRLYPSAPWTNLGFLNGAKEGAEAPYQQLWFPGNHRIVGGGGDVPELSAFATKWIAQGAEAADLTFDPVRLEALCGVADAGADDKGAAQKPALGNLWGALLADRELLVKPGETAPQVDQVSAAARARAMQLGWRPKTLEKVMDALIELD